MDTKKRTDIIITIVILIITISAVLGFIVLGVMHRNNTVLITKDEYDQIIKNYKIEENFDEIIEIHKIKYNNKILGYNYYIKDDNEYYEIIHDYEPNNGATISIYTTKYVKTNTGNIYEISNERN